MNRPPDIDARDAELLSAYLDDMLTASERAELEARLAAEPALRQELDALRITIASLRDLPPLKASRDFTLTAEQAGARPRVIRPPVWGQLAAVAAVLLVVVGLGIVLSRQPESTGVTPAVAVLSTPLTEAPEAASRAMDLPPATPTAAPTLTAQPTQEAQTFMVQPTLTAAELGAANMADDAAGEALNQTAPSGTGTGFVPPAAPESEAAVEAPEEDAVEEAAPAAAEILLAPAEEPAATPTLPPLPDLIRIILDYLLSLLEQSP